MEDSRSADRVRGRRGAANSRSVDMCSERCRTCIASERGSFEPAQRIRPADIAVEPPRITCDGSRKTTKENEDGREDHQARARDDEGASHRLSQLRAGPFGDAGPDHRELHEFITSIVPILDTVDFIATTRCNPSRPRISRSRQSCNSPWLAIESDGEPTVCTDWHEVAKIPAMARGRSCSW